MTFRSSKLPQAVSVQPKTPQIVALAISVYMQGFGMRLRLQATFPFPFFRLPFLALPRPPSIVIYPLIQVEVWRALGGQLEPASRTHFDAF